MKRKAQNQCVTTHYKITKNTDIQIGIGIKFGGELQGGNLGANPCTPL